MSGIPADFHLFAKKRLFTVLQETIPSFRLEEAIDQISGTVRVVVSGIGELEDHASQAVESVMLKYYLALEKVLNSLKHNRDIPSDFFLPSEQETVGTRKRSLASLEFCRDRNSPHADAFNRFFNVFKDYSLKTFGLVPSVMRRKAVRNGVDEFFIEFPEERLALAVSALQSFFQNNIYRCPKTRCCLRLVPPSESEKIFKIVIEDYDPTLPSSLRP